MPNQPAVIEPVIKPVIDIESILRNAKAPEVKEPKMWATLVINDQTTPHILVIQVISTVFNIPEDQALHIMLKAHRSGVGVCAVSPKDLAETRAMQATMMAINSGHALQFDVREEE